jgi:hypothetical protein
MIFLVFSTAVGAWHLYDRRSTAPIATFDKERVMRMLNDADVDTANYRIVGASNTGPGWYADSFDLENRLGRNAATYMGIFSPGGYQVAVDLRRRQLSEELYSSGASHVYNVLEPGAIIGIRTLTSEEIPLYVFPLKKRDSAQFVSERQYPVLVVERLDGGRLPPTGASEHEVRDALLDGKFRVRSIGEQDTVLDDDVRFLPSGRVRAKEPSELQHWAFKDGDLRLYALPSPVRMVTPRVLEEEIVQNSIRYFLADKGGSQSRSIQAAVGDLPGVSVARVTPYGPKMEVIEVDGVRPLV